MRDSGNAKSSEEAIEKVLAGLRDAEAPAGMERRILQGLQGRASTAEARSGWRGLVPAWVAMPSKALLFGAALAGVLAAVLVVPAIRRSGHSTAQSNAGVLPEAVVQTAPAITAGVREASSGEQRGKQKANVTASDARVVRADDAAAAAGEDVAKSDMELASFPAPPMPLTAQERLLLRLANKVDPVEMAMLDPRSRTMEDAEEKAEFQRFFGQTPVKLVDPTQPAGGEPTADQATQQATIDQGVTVQPSPDESAPAKDQAAPATHEQPIQKQAAPEQSFPDQSTTQQPTAGPIRTAEKE